ncbi:MAG: flagellar protein FliL [Petroclostridium sp.]|jgi:flagellar FliL protein|uniref:flagellar basal body-associated FliL family protein n=1 Tax=Petroclostridium xylanilyticum TaxID=1792311 RepID=UPI0012FF729D|nr:flagellar basal body-associated FliL family protein [Petroclostridium xylanilyticum]MBZ4645869.1 flagellar basal body-associated protein FliL [Clostridia bacterium]MDK2809331.1 flagellar protein FliL [Petroclostridium sp.]
MSKGNLILLGIILILVLAIAFGIGWLVVSGGQDNKEAEAKPKYDLKKSKLYAIAGEPIVSNLNTGDVKDKKVIRVKAQLRVADDKIIKVLTERNVEIVDIMISILRAKTPEEMIKPDAKEIVKNELINKINKAFNTDKVLDAFFEEFIVQ